MIKNAKIFAVASFILAFVAMYTADYIDDISAFDDPYRGYFYQRFLDVVSYFLLALGFLMLLPNWFFSYVTVSALLCRSMKTCTDLFDYHVIDWVYFAIITAVFLLYFYKNKWKVGRD